MSIKIRVTLLIMFFFSIRLHAGVANILGGSISYKFVSASSESFVYKITLELDATCPPIGQFEVPTNMNVSPEMDIFKGSNRITRVNLTLENPGGEDVTPLCPSEMSESSCRVFDGVWPSVVKYIYSIEVTLEGRDPNWSFVYNGVLSNFPYARAKYNTFIDNADLVVPNPDPPPAYDIIHLVATLNNVNEQNNSTVYTSPPTLFCGINRRSLYGLGPSDQDNDELKFKLIPTKKMIGSYLNPSIVDITYINPPYSAEHPLPTDPDSFLLNPTNGQMIFTANAPATCLIAVQADEYRNGEIVGTTMRQMTFFINSDFDNQFSVPAVVNVKNADYSVDNEGNLFLSACEGISDTVSFDVNVTDPDQNNIKVSSDNLPANASVTIENNNTQNPVVHFRWNPTEAESGTYSFFLTYTDNGCPYNTQRNATYTFTLVPHSIKFQDSSSGSCLSTADGKAWVTPIGETTIDYTYKWVDTATGNILRNVSSKIGDTLKNVPPGIYKVYVRNLDGCGKNFFIKVDTTLLPQLDLPNDTTLCEGMYLDINTKPESATTYQWNTGQNECCFKATKKSIYTVNATNHCGTSTASVNLDVVKCSYCFFIPNAFTPNGDGNNDVFKITPTCLTDKYKLFIYNRWGQLVFNSFDIQNSWDGTIRGHEVEQGTYYYVLNATLDNSTHDKIQLTGDVNVIR